MASRENASEMLTVDQLIDLEVKVREQVSVLEREVDDKESKIRPPKKLDGSTEGRLARQDTLLNHELAKESQRRRKQHLELLREALRRMDNATYGICLNCRGSISYERLMIQPEAQVCQKCIGGGNS